MGEPSESTGAASADESFEVERFEYVRASETLGLLRVVGRWGPTSDDPSRALLLASVRGEFRHFFPLSVGDDAAQWSIAGQESRGVAFCVPLPLVDEDDVRFSLRPSPDCIVALGTPTQRLLPEPLAPNLRAGDLLGWRRHLRAMVADGEDLERRVVALSRTIHDRAGLRYLPLKQSINGRGERDQPVARLREEVGEGLTRVAALQARLTDLVRELRSDVPAEKQAGAERSEPPY